MNTNLKPIKTENMGGHYHTALNTQGTPTTAVGGRCSPLGQTMGGDGCTFWKRCFTHLSQLQNISSHFISLCRATSSRMSLSLKQRVRWFRWVVSGEETASPSHQGTATVTRGL